MGISRRGGVGGARGVGSGPSSLGNRNLSRQETNGLKAATSKSKGSDRGEIVKEGRMSMILGRLSVMIGTLLITLPSRQSN